MKKKAFATMLVLSMVAVELAGCGSSDTTATTQAPAATKAPATTQAPTVDADTKAVAPAADSRELIRADIINNDPNESGYRIVNDIDLEVMFTKENGYDASFTYSLENDEQITTAQKLIQDEMDYLLLSTVDTPGWDSVLKDAQDAGIGVILFDCTIDVGEDLYLASIVSDMNKEGDTAVKWLADQGSDDCNIIHTQGVTGPTVQQGRTGALDTKVAAEASWDLVTQQTAEWNSEKVQQIVQSVINSGTKFSAIYAGNDNMAKGTVAVLDKVNVSHGVGKDVIVMDFDCNKWALQGPLDQNWNHGGQRNPFQAVHIDEVIKKVESEEVFGEKTIIMGEKGFDATIITTEDVEKYGI